MELSPNIYKPIKNYKFKYSLVRQRVASNASRNIYSYKFFLPYNFRYKKLTYYKKNNAGFSMKTSKILRSKGSRKIKYMRPNINYTFNDTHIYFIGGLIFIPYINKAVSILFLSTGSITYLTTTNNHNLFTLQRAKAHIKPIPYYARQAVLSYQNYNILSIPILIKQLPKNKDICLVEQYPTKGIQYIRSSGSKGKILKMDSRTNIAVVLLPSKALKTVSTYSLCSEGYVFFTENKKYKNTKSGYYRKHGIKPVVRGVAMNPIDHPHGGRTKSIKLPRTPWGTVAKRK